MQYTDEQQIGISYKGDLLVMKSGAGTGKTTLLKGFAKANPTKRMLYICFNKAIQEEAQLTFPKNVVCRTGHSIAYARKGKALSHKLSGNLRMTDVKRYLNLASWSLVSDTISVFNNFLVSAHKTITLDNAVGLSIGTSKQMQHAKTAVDGARRLWIASIDPSENGLPCVHDVYMKLYCLDEPELHTWFSTILLDEAQDSNPVLSDFVARQKCQKIIVGDDHQQLYRFRGANNAMTDFIVQLNADVARITKSFRFGNNIAYIANQVLAFKRRKTHCEEFIISGNENLKDQIYYELPASLAIKQYTKLHRTVSGTLMTGLDNITRKIHWIGGIDNYNIQEILDVYHFSIENKKEVKRKKLFVEFSSYYHYESVAKDSNDIEMKRIVKIIGSHGGKLPRLITLLRRNECKTENAADLVIGTAHRAKGLEWDSVCLASDFPDLLDPDSDLDEAQLADELNLLYVACTRAILNLEPCNVVFDIMKELDPSGYQKRRKIILANAININSDKKEFPTSRFHRPTGNPSLPAQRVTLED